jgi:predicted GIY-YIG superfamily endonuclease
MSFPAYMIRCVDYSYYVGHTDNLAHRMGQHDAGEIPGYTQTRRPVRLVWAQDFPTREEAIAAERQINGWSRAKKEALVLENWDRVRLLARNSSARMRDENEALRLAPPLRYGAAQGERMRNDRKPGAVHDPAI